MENTDLKLPLPPRSGDVVFQIDGTSPGYVGDPQVRDVLYMVGYRRGARQLAEVVSKQGYDIDCLVFPVIYLSRHHVELILKRMLVMLANLTGEQLDKGHMHHRLSPLWKDIKRFLEMDEMRTRHSLMLDQRDIDGVDSYIEQLSNVDPDSFAFRYAQSKKGEDSLPKDLTHISIVAFSSHMERLCGYLDGIDSYLDEMVSLKNELTAEYRDYYDDY